MVLAVCSSLLPSLLPPPGPFYGILSSHLDKYFWACQDCWLCTIKYSCKLSLVQLGLMQALVVRSHSNLFFLIWCPKRCYSWKTYPLPHILGMASSLAADYQDCDWTLHAANWNTESPEYIGSYMIAPELNVMTVFFFSFTSQDSVLTVAPENFLL